jgi:hypothetical protein
MKLGTGIEPRRAVLECYAGLHANLAIGIANLIGCTGVRMTTTAFRCRDVLYGIVRAGIVCAGIVRADIVRIGIVHADIGPIDIKILRNIRACP